MEHKLIETRRIGNTIELGCPACDRTLHIEMTPEGLVVDFVEQGDLRFNHGSWYSGPGLEMGIIDVDQNGVN